MKSEKTHITERSAVAVLMSWMREIIEKHNLDLGLPIVETAGRDNKFPDMEIYVSRRSEDCLCLFEVKRPNFDVFELKEPARRKATERKSKYFVLLNFRKLVWFDTAKVNAMLPEINKRPTLKARENWYDLGERKFGDAAWIYVINDRYITFENKEPKVYMDCELFDIYFINKATSCGYFAYLNSSINALFSEIGGRTCLGQGALKTQVYEV